MASLSFTSLTHSLHSQERNSQNFAQKSEGGVNFPKEIPLNEISENTKILQKNHLRRIRYFWVQNSKKPDPHKEFFFPGSNPLNC